MTTRRVVILGAAGRDFHNFNTVYRDNPDFEVVAFTATQIPDIAGRRYPAVLAGKLYPEGIPIFDESELVDLIQREQVDAAVFSYSDVPHATVMHLASLCIAHGCDFEMTLGGSTGPLGKIVNLRSKTSRWKYHNCHFEMVTQNETDYHISSGFHV